VYLIDEVHMFSGHSFNALLKTLEEPPPHVKFLLATTDPQKVPVTVLSRCLQFNLKRLVPEEIRGQLAHILQRERVEFEEHALSLLARAADGSMRDALSLLDQAIAFGGGRVFADEVRTMLGTVSRELSLNLVDALARLDGPRVLDEVAGIAELTPDFSGVLQEVLGILHRVALFQQVPSTLVADDPDRKRILAIAESMQPEDVQLFYQIGLIGQQDLPLAPDPRTGIEMVLLRMLAFRPDTLRSDARVDAQRRRDSGSELSRPSPPVRGGSKGEGRAPIDRSRGGAVAALADARRAIAPEETTAAGSKQASAINAGRQASQLRPLDEMPRPEVSLPTAVESESTGMLGGPEDWHGLVGRLGLRGVASELAGNCDVAGWDGHRLCLLLDPACQHMQVASAEERLHAALTEVLGSQLKLEIRIAESVRETPAQRRARLAAEQRARAETLMRDDPVARMLQDQLDAQWVSDSIEPTDEKLPDGGEKA
jgi:DNA polymerase-3 subunit gamma/tau